MRVKRIALGVTIMLIGARLTESGAAALPKPTEGISASETVEQTVEGPEFSVKWSIIGMKELDFGKVTPRFRPTPELDQFLRHINGDLRIEGARHTDLILTSRSLLAEKLDRLEPPSNYGLYALIDDEQRRSIMEAIHVSDDAVVLIGSPWFTVRNGQEESFLKGPWKAYPALAQSGDTGGNGANKMLMGLVRSAVKFCVKPTTTRDEKSVVLELTTALENFGNSGQLEEVRAFIGGAPKDDVEIASRTPFIQSFSVRTKIEAPLGKSLLLILGRILSARQIEKPAFLIFGKKRSVEYDQSYLLLLVTIKHTWRKQAESEQKDMEGPEALFPVLQNGKRGYINRGGKTVIEPQFEAVGGLCWRTPTCGNRRQMAQY